MAEGYTDAELAALNSLTGMPVAGQIYSDAILGPSMVGWQVNLFLFGVFAHAFFCYTQTTLYKRDSWRTKLLFWLVFVIGAVEAGLNFQQSYHFGTSQQRDILTLDNGPVEGNAQPVLTGIVGTLVQSYLVRRSAAFFSSKTVGRLYSVVMGTLVFASFVGSVFTSCIGFMYMNQTWEKLVPLTFNGAMSIWLWNSAGVDLILSLALFYNLRRRLGHNRTTDSIIAGLIRVTLQTAAPTAFFAVGGAAVSSAFSNGNFLTNDVSYGLFLPMSSLYCISLMTTVNSRTKLAKKVGVVTQTEDEDDSGTMAAEMMQEHGIRVHVSRHVMREVSEEESRPREKLSTPAVYDWDQMSPV